MKYLIEHETRVAFPAPVREHHSELRLAPIDDHTQQLLGFRLEVEPKAEVYGYRDCFGNQVHHFAIMSGHDHLITRMHAEVETLVANPFEYETVAPARERAWIEHSLRQAPRLWDFVLYRSPATPALPDDLDGLSVPGYASGLPLLQQVQAAMVWVHENFEYDPDITHVHSALEEVLEARAGVCQDFAHLLIAVVRAWGFPARYVMGYQDAAYFDPDEDEADAEPLPQATHAWAEVLIPGAGWRGFDPTHRILADDTYIRVAVGRDYRDAAPQRGSFKGEQASAEPEVLLEVRRQATQRQQQRQT